MLEVRNVNAKFEQCLNCKRPVDKEVVISYGWYCTPIQLCDKCLSEALEMLVSEKKEREAK